MAEVPLDDSKRFFDRPAFPPGAAGAPGKIEFCRQAAI
jgi:hypothetical protein